MKYDFQTRSPYPPISGEGVKMTMETGTVGKLQSLIRLYHEGYRSPAIDQAVGKLIALEVEQSQAELQRLEARLLPTNKNII
jgi:hypothetical protein